MAQILLCGLVSGMTFAAVENVIYLNFYIPNAAPGIVAWRWSVCVLLHAGCSTLAAFGVARIWTQFRRGHRMPRLADGAPWLFAAFVLHSLYNLAATLMEALGTWI